MSGGSDVAFKVANGYTTLPSGLIIQWGNIIISLNSNSTKSGIITYPFAFPNAIFSVVVTSAQAVDVKTFTKSNATVLITKGNTFPFLEACATSWMAIGY